MSGVSRRGQNRARTAESLHAARESRIVDQHIDWSVSLLGGTQKCAATVGICDIKCVPKSALGEFQRVQPLLTTSAETQFHAGYVEQACSSYEGEDTVKECDERSEGASV